jgi:hypothetical protein
MEHSLHRKAVREMFMLGGIRKIWPELDVFDRVFCLSMSSLAVAGGAALLTSYHTWKDIGGIVPVMFVMAWYPWVTIPRQLRDQRLRNSICGDNSGPTGGFCVLEPGHPGDHKQVYSWGGSFSWPRKGGA